MGTTWTNDDGLVVQFGTRTSEDKRGGVVSTAGNVEEMVVDFAYDDLPDGSTDGSYTTIPSGAMILDAYFEVTAAFVGGTSYDIDLVDTAGSAIGSGEDKLFDALVTADINAIGERNSARTHGGTNSGNALDTELASAGMLKAAATGTFTAGAGRMVIRYIP